MTDGSTSSPSAEERLGTLAAALQEATLPACVRDAAGRYVTVNAAFAELVGLEPARLAGKTDAALQPADVAHRVAELDALVLEAHGHLDAGEVVLARDGRRSMRACRFPVYENGEPWAVCVVMGPGDDRRAGATQRERLQAAAGQSAGEALSAPAQELALERARTAEADAAALAAREQLAVEREARLEAELQARAANEEVGRQGDTLEQLRGEAARLGTERDAAAERVQAVADELAETLRRRDELDAEIGALRVGHAGLRDELDATATGRDALEAQLTDLRHRHDAAVVELEQERARVEDLRGELDAAQDAERAAEAAAAGADARREELERALATAHQRTESLLGELEEARAEADARVAAERERAAEFAAQVDERLAAERERVGTIEREALERTLGGEAAAAELAEAREARRAAELERDRALDAHARTREALDHHRTVAGEADARLAELRAAHDEALAALDAAAAGADETLRQAQDAHAALADAVAAALARAEHAEAEAIAAQARLDQVEAALEQAEARARDAERDRSEATAAISAELELVAIARDEALAALAAEQQARAAADERIVELLAATAALPPAMTSPFANGGPALPPLAVATAQARPFAFNAPDQPTAPPPGLTPAALQELQDGVARAASPRAAGRAALQALGAATGWHGGALWQPSDEGDFGCAETWSASMSGLDAWETMAWRAHLEDGLVPAAAGSGVAHWADTDEMLACPRARSAAWAELGTVATVPVRHPDGRVMAVLELVRRGHDAADPELLAALTGAAAGLAERLLEIEQELASVVRY